MRQPLTRLLSRALRLQCPRCGTAGVMASWTTLRERCLGCGLALDRGEKDDYWLGAYAINWVAGEGIALLIALGVLLATWPETKFALWTGIGAAVVVPLALFPFSRTVWLAVDLALRPVEPGDDS